MNDTAGSGEHEARQAAVGECIVDVIFECSRGRDVLRLQLESGVDLVLKADRIRMSLVRRSHPREEAQ